MTGLDLISSALRLCGVLASGETASGAEGQDALASLNDMIDSWQTERMMIFTVQRQLFNLTAGQQTYTLGTGGDFNIARPVNIERAGIINLGNPIQPLEIPISMLTTAQWAAIPVKNIQSALPLNVYDDGAFPLRNLAYWTVPNVFVQTTLYCWQLLSQFADLATDYTFPQGYNKALRYNLAAELAPEYGKTLDPVVALQAIASKAAVKSINAPVVDLKCDPAVVSPDKRLYNWLTDNASSGRSY